MLKYLMLILSLNYTCSCVAQQKVLDQSVFGNWPTVGAPSMSNDGHYASYPINNGGGKYSFVVQDIRSNWQLKLIDARQLCFSQDSKKIIFTRRDSIYIVSLGNSGTSYIPGISFFKQVNIARDDNWLVYGLKKEPGRLLLQNLRTGEIKSYDAVVNYWFSSNGKVLILEKTGPASEVNDRAIEWVDLTDSKSKLVWHGNQAASIIFSADNRNIAFIGKEKQNDRDDVWLFVAGTDQAVRLAGPDALGLGDSLAVQALRAFSLNNDHVFISLTEKKRPVAISKLTSSVDIWNYQDKVLQSEQLVKSGSLREYLAVINIKDHHLIRLESAYDQLISPISETTENYVLVSSGQGGDEAECYWNKASSLGMYLISLTDGSRTLVNAGQYATLARFYTLSPQEKYVVYYDAGLKAYCSYSITEHRTRNISIGIKQSFITNAQDDVAETPFRPIGYGGWWKTDSAILVYTRHDIFILDPSGNTPPRNLTGANHFSWGQLIFRLAFYNPGQELDTNTTLLLNVFDQQNKDNGYYRVNIANSLMPEKLTMQHCVFNGPEESENVPLFHPIKARDRDIYIVRRMKASESANYFTTSDFKSFQSLSAVYPERQYNWLTTELITWSMLDGRTGQGILYKPANFDPRKKYPIIFNYYEKVSESLHAYLVPGAAIGQINIPYLVSNGYLVFTPDIHYCLEGQGYGAYNSVVSAALFFAKKSWVDSRKMGINGHSRGGFETDYLVAHTSIFAAAASGSSYADALSLYGGVRPRGSARAGAYEMGSQRIGATPWQRPDIYLANSPVLYADRITTPLLMMNNRGDQDIPFEQGVELFTALRRLGKRVWMLQYDGEGHLLLNAKDSKDYTIRLQQFFDHYLKDAPAPIWMTRGIPAKNKGTDTGYAYDSLIKTPGPGVLMKNEVKTATQKAILQHRTSINNRGWIVNVPPIAIKK